MRRFFLITLVLAAACGGDDSDDDDVPVDAFESTCGMPGDVGNELGVGKFCTTLNECSDTVDAALCATLGDPTAYFCTKTCQAADVGACGTGAECTCSGGNCGCVPSTCLD